MLQTVKSLVGKAAATECQHCGQAVGKTYVLEDVKIPGYTGVHEKPFCQEECLHAWKKHVEQWEESNHDIPMTNTGPNCTGC